MVLTGRFNECILLRITVCADCDVACYICRRSRNLGTSDRRPKLLARAISFDHNEPQAQNAPTSREQHARQICSGLGSSGGLDSWFLIAAYVSIRAS